MIFLKKEKLDENGAILPFFLVFLSGVALPLIILMVDLLGLYNAKAELQIFVDASALNASQNGSVLVNEKWTKYIAPSYCGIGTTGEGLNYSALSYHLESNSTMAKNAAQTLLNYNISKNSLLKNFTVFASVKELYGVSNHYVWNGQNGTDETFHNAYIASWAKNSSERTVQITIKASGYYIPMFALGYQVPITLSSTTEQQYQGAPVVTQSSIPCIPAPSKKRNTSTNNNIGVASSVSNTNTNISAKVSTTNTNTGTKSKISVNTQTGASVYAKSSKTSSSPPSPITNFFGWLSWISTY